MIFRQVRLGQHGQPFTILKIETMRGNIVTHPWLRRLGLDELPQVINILRGEMALFGPRPELPDIHASLSEAIGETWDARLRVKPGILSLACVKLAEARQPGRYSVRVKTEQAKLDLAQINGGWRVKLAILVRVPGAIMRGQTS